MEERKFTFLGKLDEGQTRLSKIWNLYNKIKDGSQVRFWEDIWLGNRSLRDKYPQLYNIVRKKQDTVADVLSTQISNLSWHRDLFGNKLAMWNNLASRLASVRLNQERDGFKWNLDQTGVFQLNHIIWV